MSGQTRTRRRHERRALGRSKHWSGSRGNHDVAEGLLATVLSECLDEMQRNGGDIETAIMHNPDLAGEVRPLLEIAAMLRPAKT